MTEQPNALDLGAALTKAQSMLDRYIPDPGFRNAALGILSKAIRVIHQKNPNCWSINFGDKGPWLLTEHEWALYIFGLSREVSFHIYAKKLDNAALNKLEMEAKLEIDKADLWSTVTIRLPDQAHLIELFWPAFLAYLEEKAKFKIHKSSIRPHIMKGAGLVEYIRVNEIDRDLPQPGYVFGGRDATEPGNNGESMDLSLSDLVNLFALNGLSFTPWQVATFYTALQTKGFVILSGISGTGKTKLAQTFARLLPQPSTQSELPPDLIQIAVQPYMLKYNRMIIPRTAAQLFSPINPGQTIHVKLSFGDKSEECKLQHAVYANTDYTQILLKGRARVWFKDNFSVNDTIILEPNLDGDDTIVGFQLGKPENFSRSEAFVPEDSPNNYLFLSVRPDWRDSKSLFGYYNPIDQEYHSTPFLEFIKKAHASYKRQEKFAWFVLLDEMNLARVEYYFSDLLSVMESGRDQDGWSREPIRLDYPLGLEMADYQREIRLPPNLYFIGTVNVDETTHAFSPKVLDRAFTLELTEADFSTYPIRIDPSIAGMNEQKKSSLLDGFTRKGRYALIEKEKIYEYLSSDPDVLPNLKKLNEILQPYDLHFGYRVLDEITAFLDNAEENGFYDEDDESFDAAILMKILPKFHGSRTKLEDPLKQVLAWCFNPLSPDIGEINKITNDGTESVSAMIAELERLDYIYKHTARRVIRMLRSLYSTGFAAFG